MPDPESGLAPFTVGSSTRASEIKRALDAATRLAIADVSDKLQEDPDAFADSTHRLAPDSNVFVYTHGDPPLEVMYTLDRERKTIFLLHFAVPAVRAEHHIFVSYSHKDQLWRDRLWTWLEPLEVNGRVRKIWDDRGIQAGDKWEEEIRAALAQATAAILLVSQDFMASEFIRQVELPRLLEAEQRRDLQLLWIAVRRSSWADTGLKEFQALNDPRKPLQEVKDEEQDGALQEIYDQLKKVLSLS